MLVPDRLDALMFPPNTLLCVLVAVIYPTVGEVVPDRVLVLVQKAKPDTALTGVDVDMVPLPLPLVIAFHTELNPLVER